MGTENEGNSWYDSYKKEGDFHTKLSTFMGGSSDVELFADISGDEVLLSFDIIKPKLEEKLIHLFVDSFIHSLIRWFIHSFVRSFIHFVFFSVK